MKRPNKNMQCSAIFVCRRWRCIYDFLLHVAVALDAFILKSDGEKLDKDGFECNNNMIIRFSLRFFGFHNTIMTQKSKLKQKAERAENYSAQMYCKKNNSAKRTGSWIQSKIFFFNFTLWLNSLFHHPTRFCVSSFHGKLVLIQTQSNAYNNRGAGTNTERANSNNAMFLFWAILVRVSERINLTLPMERCKRFSFGNMKKTRTPNNDIMDHLLIVMCAHNADTGFESNIDTPIFVVVKATILLLNDIVCSPSLFLALTSMCSVRLFAFFVIDVCVCVMWWWWQRENWRNLPLFTCLLSLFCVVVGWHRSLCSSEHVNRYVLCVQMWRFENIFIPVELYQY